MSKATDLEGLRFRGKADPYLEWGYSTRFRSFSKRSRSDKSPGIGLLLEWSSIDDARAAAVIAGEMKLRIARVYLGSKDDKFPAPLRTTWSMSGPSDRLVDFIDRAFDHLGRVELAAPLVVRESPLERLAFMQSDMKVVAGVLDDGCAFANHRFMKSPNVTRVLWLWDQDPASTGLPVTGIVSPTPNVDFGYGGHWSRVELDNALAASGTPEAAYATTNLVSLRRAATHGTHVADLVAGDADWDIVFVQWPRAAIEDPTGRWLSVHALNGLFYVIACAGPATKTIIVNLSWGPQTDGHDGQGILEKAFDEAVAEQLALGRELIITLASGNSHGSQSHASFEVQAGGEVQWVIPPDGRVPMFLEIWWPPAMPLDAIALTVRAPSGDSFLIQGPVVPPGGQKFLADYGHVVLEDRGVRGVVALVTIEATEQRVSPRGLAGRWGIAVAGIEIASPLCDAFVEVYVARADHNMGAHRRAKAAYLTDVELDRARFFDPARRAEEAPGSAIRRRGTLNGIGTGASAWTVGGFRHSDLGPAPYTSSGPTRGARTMPDASCVTDRSVVRQGVRAAGVRSGTKALLIGTSTAAPQLARKAALKDWATEVKPSDYDPLRLGLEMLKADQDLLGPD